MIHIAKISSLLLVSELAAFLFTVLASILHHLRFFNLLLSLLQLFSFFVELFIHKPKLLRHFLTILIESCILYLRLSKLFRDLIHLTHQFLLTLPGLLQQYLKLLLLLDNSISIIFDLNADVLQLSSGEPLNEFLCRHNRLVQTALYDLLLQVSRKAFAKVFGRHVLCIRARDLI